MIDPVTLGATLWRARGLIVGGLAAVGLLAVLAYVSWLKSDIAELERDKLAISTDRDTWQAASIANEAAIGELKAARDRDVAAIAADRDRLVRQLANLSQARKEVARAAQTQDAPPAGVLLVARGQLARLRAGSGGDDDQGREGASAGRAPDLRP